MLEICGLKRTCWCEAVPHNATVHRPKILPELGLKAPMEAVLGTIPDTSKFRIFEYTAFVYVY